MRAIRELRAKDKNGEFTQERSFQRVANIPISGALNELSEMDFVNDGGFRDVDSHTRRIPDVFNDYFYRS